MVTLGTLKRDFKICGYIYIYIWDGVEGAEMGDGEVNNIGLIPRILHQGLRK